MIGWMFLLGLIAGVVAVVIIHRGSEVTRTVDVSPRVRAFAPAPVIESAHDAI